MSDDDIVALYAYFMQGVTPVNAANRRTRHSLAAVDALAAGDLAQDALRRRPDTVAFRC